MKQFLTEKIKSDYLESLKSFPTHQFLMKEKMEHLSDNLFKTS